MQLTSTVRAIGLIGLIGVSSCGGNDGTGPGDREPPEASFDYQLRADIQLSVTGDSLDIEVGEAFGAGILWQLHLQGGSNNENGGISLVYRGEKPAEGSYMVRTVSMPADLSGLAQDEFAAFAELDPGAEATRFLGFETSGEITIARADALGYEGTFDFDADGAMFPPDESAQDATVNFSGSFQVPR